MGILIEKRCKPLNTTTTTIFITVRAIKIFTNLKERSTYGLGGANTVGSTEATFFLSCTTSVSNNIVISTDNCTLHHILYLFCGIKNT